MMYTEKYSNDDLFDMFANDADAQKLLFQNVDEVAKQLEELAPDMEDAQKVAQSIQRTAGEKARHELG